MKVYTFYGPWRVELVSGDPSPPTRLRVTGSAGSDSLHGVTFDPPLALEIDGQEWTLGLLYAETPLTDPPVWLSSEFDAGTRFVPRDGLIVDLISDKKPLEFRPTLQLLCTCMDPEMNPNPTENPYDFTTPG